MFNNKKQMKRMRMKWLVFSALFGLCVTTLQAQTLNEAKALYNDEKYAEAKPVFEKLVRQSPGNASYNLWYGVCCFETGDLVPAEKYLSVAVRRKVIDAFRYMGELYYQTYRFDKAVEMYEDYIGWLAKKKRETEAAELRLEEMENAARMLDKVEAVEVIDSMVVDKDEILNTYVLSEESGSLIPYGDFFQSAEHPETVVYRNQKGNKVYYGKETGDNHFCLFTQSLLMDKWGDEKQLPMNVNSNNDDNYPFVLADGVTVYYASKGNGSLGGYDLFVTRYNMNSDTYLSPEQLGMPFNSPFNDYMLVIDEVKQLGWFVSDRFQPEGKVCVYLFVPNDQRARVESEDIELKRAWASLRPIRTTWKQDSDYSELIALSHEEIPYGRQDKNWDFEFPVTPSKVYHLWSDFKSAEARNIYKQALAVREQIEKLEQQLESLHSRYTSEKNAPRKEQLKGQILEKEERLLSLASQSGELEKKARNIEGKK